MKSFSISPTMNSINKFPNQKYPSLLSMTIVIEKVHQQKVTLLVRPQLNLSFCRQIFRLLFESRNCSSRSEHYAWHSWRISGWNDNLEKVFDVNKKNTLTKRVQGFKMYKNYFESKLDVFRKCDSKVIKTWIGMLSPPNHLLVT